MTTSGLPDTSRHHDVTEWHLICSHPGCSRRVHQFDARLFARATTCKQHRPAEGWVLQRKVSPAEAVQTAEDAYTEFCREHEQDWGPGYPDVCAEAERLRDNLRRLYDDHNVHEFERIAL